MQKISLVLVICLLGLSSCNLVRPFIKTDPILSPGVNTTVAPNTNGTLTVEGDATSQIVVASSTISGVNSSTFSIVGVNISPNVAISKTYPKNVTKKVVTVEKTTISSGTTVIEKTTTEDIVEKVKSDPFLKIILLAIICIIGVLLFIVFFKLFR